MNLIRGFRNLLSRRPLLTNMISTGLLAASGDGIAQLVVERKQLDSFNFRRTCKFFTLGCFLVAPSLGAWYKLLERVKVKSKWNVTPLVRVLIDQVLFAPCFIVIFLTSLRFLDGGTLEAATNQVQRDFPNIYKTNLKVWPATQLVNFYLIPLQYRVLAVQCVALFWNIYLAHATEGEKHVEFDEDVQHRHILIAAHPNVKPEPQLDIILE